MTASLQSLLQACATVFVTNEQVSGQTRPGQKISRVDIALAAGSAALIREPLVHSRPQPLVAW